MSGCPGYRPEGVGLANSRCRQKKLAGPPYVIRLTSELFRALGELIERGAQPLFEAFFQDGFCVVAFLHLDHRFRCCSCAFRTGVRE